MPVICFLGLLEDIEQFLWLQSCDSTRKVTCRHQGDEYCSKQSAPHSLVMMAKLEESTLLPGMLLAL
jgi:hypothetical protein